MLFTTIGLSSRYNKGLHANTKAQNSYFETVSIKFAFPLFLDRIDKFLLFAFDTSELMKIMFINWMCKNAEFTISDSTSTYTEEKTKESDKKEKEEIKNRREEDKREEKVRIEIAETWDSLQIVILFIQICIAIREFVIKFHFVSFVISCF
jgi:hypothetical protein